MSSLMSTRKPPRLFLHWEVGYFLTSVVALMGAQVNTLLPGEPGLDLLLMMRYLSWRSVYTADYPPAPSSSAY